MAPGCKYCLANGDKLHNTWCSGSCEFDEIEGTCTEIKGTCKNTLYPLAFINHIMYLCQEWQTIFPFI